MRTFFASEVQSSSLFAAHVLCAVLAAICATALFAVTTADRFQRSSFHRRFFFLLWRYTLPTGVFSFVIYWLIWGGLQ
jgi:hypothetical protein